MEQNREEIIEGNCCVWDYTGWAIKENEEENWEKLNEIAKKWSYQIEKCPNSGKLHYQVRVSLKVKSRGKAAYEKLKEIFGPGHITPTSKTNRDNNFYVMKIESRLKGPWTDESTEKLTNIPWDVKEFEITEDWMKDAIKYMEETKNKRKIKIYIDPEGSNGKSSFKRWCVFQEGLNCTTVPPFNNIEDICQFVMSIKISSNYIIDLPRAMPKDKLDALWAGIEMLKEGYAYDKRYKGKQLYFDPPNIIVFTNWYPDVRCLSTDRWDIYIIKKVEPIPKMEEQF